MIDRIRRLPVLLRYVVYIACILLVFFVAAGAGATVAFVVNWQSGRVESNSGGSDRSGANEQTLMETTGKITLSENTVSETPSNANKSADKASFTHRAKDGNSSGDYTYIGNPLIDGDPGAVVLAVPSSQTKATGYAHNIGVWYEPQKEKWAIFDQDHAAVPPGTTFEVTIPRTSKSFVHHAKLLNIVGDSTYLDNSLTNGEPDAALSVTQNWNPGGGGGVYNDHAIGILYDRQIGQWLIRNKDGAPIPKGTAFNVAVSGK